MKDEFEFPWCEIHNRPCDELREDDEGHGYYDCPECMDEEHRVMEDEMKAVYDPHPCFKCGKLMAWVVCKECGGKGWTSPNIGDNDCLACHQHGGEWVCHHCNIAEY